MSQGFAQPEPERLLSADELAPILGRFARQAGTA
jgi:hypothetical protein